MNGDRVHLLRSFELARTARANGDHPFGALLVVADAVVAEAVNRVNTDHNLMAHAETMLIAQLERSRQLSRLAQGIVYASCEPCPMCVGALFWAGATQVVFGLSSARLNEISTAPGQPVTGFYITAQEIGSSATPPMLVKGPFLEDEAELVHAGAWFSFKV
jgi:tRNA(Arg) A34 adenosine deaminase TadA